MTEANRPKHIYTAHPVVKATQLTPEKKRVLRNWRKLMAGQCPKGHEMKGVAIKQTIIGWCSICQQEEPLK